MSLGTIIPWSEAQMSDESQAVILWEWLGLAPDEFLHPTRKSPPAKDAVYPDYHRHGTARPLSRGSKVRLTPKSTRSGPDV
jgi:hypothetical protein